MLAVCRQIGSILQVSAGEAYTCSLSSRAAGRSYASRFCSTSPAGSSATKKSLEELTQDSQSKDGKRLFQKVIDGVIRPQVIFEPYVVYQHDPLVMLLPMA